MNQSVFISIAAFLAGLVSASVFWYIFILKKDYSQREELVYLKSRLESSDKLKEIVKQDFTQLACEIIKREQEDLRKQNREALEEKIAPLKNELGEFKAKVEKFNISGTENTVKIIEQISNLEKNNRIIETETKNLVDALTKNRNTKGFYGESLLETILQSCGMKEGIHYTKQLVTTASSLSDNTEHTIRPDIVINLPDERCLIIDSKVTLSSYTDFIEDNSKLKDFKSEVKKRITELSEKNYQKAQNTIQPDFVIMYMPVEPAVSLLYEDSELIQFAYNANVIISGTSSLLTTIRLVNQLFAQQKQNKNIDLIINAGTNLYNTFVQFCEDLIDIQKRFENVSIQLNKTINRFRRGNKSKQSLFSQVELLKEYGINSVKQIPTELLEIYDTEEKSENTDIKGELIHD